MRIQVSGIELDLSAEWSATVSGIPFNPDIVKRFNLFKLKVKRYSQGKYVTYRLFDCYVPDIAVYQLSETQLLIGLQHVVINALAFIETQDLLSFSKVFNYDLYDPTTISIRSLCEKDYERLSMLGFCGVSTFNSVLFELEEMIRSE